MQINYNVEWPGYVQTSRPKHGEVYKTVESLAIGETIEVVYDTTKQARNLQSSIIGYCKRNWETGDRGRPFTAAVTVRDNIVYICKRPV